jgi:hypothetical protein
MKKRRQARMNAGHLEQLGKCAAARVGVTHVTGKVLEMNFDPGARRAQRLGYDVAADLVIQEEDE